MSNQELFLALVMSLPPQKRDELWDELEERGIISGEVGAA